MLALLRCVVLEFGVNGDGRARVRDSRGRFLYQGQTLSLNNSAVSWLNVSRPTIH